MLFIKNENQPAAISEGYAGHDIVFDRNTLQTEDETLAAQLVCRGYELIAEDDPRREWMLAHGWSRHSQRDYALNHPVAEEPVE